MEYMKHLAFLFVDTVIKYPTIRVCFLFGSFLLFLLSASFNRMHHKWALPAASIFSQASALYHIHLDISHLTHFLPAFAEPGLHPWTPVCPSRIV
jgi:hypothetical protein